MENYHQPALLSEVVDFLDPRPGQTFVDCTLGGGGHALSILERIGPDGLLIGIDKDQDALDYSRERLAKYKENLLLYRRDFSELESALSESSVGSVDGALFDLGVSSRQLDNPDKGFSFSADAPLDMRMDTRRTTTAADLVNDLPERELADLIYRYSDERWARRIAKNIVNQRNIKPIRTTAELAEIVVRAIPAKALPPKTHGASRTFQALRIAVNSELDSLEAGLKAAAQALKQGGRIAAISYHSLEDRIVKRFFVEQSGRCKCPPNLPVCVCGAAQVLRVVTKKPIVPTEEEIRDNPRSRSAKLRVAEKI